MKSKRFAPSTLGAALEPRSLSTVVAPAIAIVAPLPAPDPLPDPESPPPPYPGDDPPIQYPDLPVAGPIGPGIVLAAVGSRESGVATLDSNEPETGKSAPTVIEPIANPTPLNPGVATCDSNVPHTGHSSPIILEPIPATPPTTIVA